MWLKEEKRENNCFGPEISDRIWLLKKMRDHWSLQLKEEVEGWEFWRRSYSVASMFPLKKGRNICWEWELGVDLGLAERDKDYQVDSLNRTGEGTDRRQAKGMTESLRGPLSLNLQQHKSLEYSIFSAVWEGGAEEGRLWEWSRVDAAGQDAREWKRLVWLFRMGSGQRAWD